MPVIPPSSSTPYDSMSVVINMVRARMDDALDTLAANSGKILEETDSFSQQTVNNGWRQLQDVLVDRGYENLTDDVVISGIPQCSVTDPAIFTWIGWQGCFDGANLFTVPALPQNFTHPLKVWERWSNTGMQFGDPMEQMYDGLPNWPKTTASRVWEWRNDLIYMPGSQNVMDIRVRFAKYMPDFDDIGQVRWYQQPVPIMRAADALSWMVCRELAMRPPFTNPEAEAAYYKYGCDACNRILNRDARAKQRGNVRRMSRSGRLEGSGYGYGYGG
jgi:hypothetical protein